MKQIIKKGDKFGRLTAVRFDHCDKWSLQYWLFNCNCGIKKVIRVGSVKMNKVKSCGCLNTEIRKTGNNGKIHGMSDTKTYKSWSEMKQRCLNKNHKFYKHYGGRGIVICKEWLNKNGFQNFYKDMGDRPKGKTLDRIKNDLGYCKENCRWATPKEQGNNTRANRFLTFDNKTQTIAQWSEEININYGTLYSRIGRCKWSIRRALTFNIKK